MPQPFSRTFQVRHALLRHLAPRYQQASPAQKTLLPSLPTLVTLLEQHGHLCLTEEERRQLLAMSVSTAERFLRTQRKPHLRGLPTTTPGSSGKGQIPMRVFSRWDENRPGFVEMDLVAHCGDHLDGTFLYTLTLTDLATGWTECLPLLDKSADAVLAALAQARTLFPFPLLGIDTDSGAEFLNAEVIGYCEQEQLTFTRGRPGIKNDQCHVEQKNGAVVRKAVGCARLVGVQAYHQLHEVYQVLRLVVNCFQPSLKLQARVPQGERVRRVYDVAQTPLQRLLASGVLSEDRQRDLRERVQQIDPLALSEQLDALRYALLCGAGGRVWPQPGLSLALSTSIPLLASAGEPERTGHQEAPSSSKEIGRLEPRPTEPDLPEEVVSGADQSSVQAQPLPTPASGTPSDSTREDEAGHGALITIEQAIAAYVQEMRVSGRDPKTLQWHQTSLGALRRYLWRQFHLTDVRSMTTASLRTWLTELSIAPSARTGGARTISTVAAYARSARAFCNWLVRQGYVSETLFPQDAVPKPQRGLPQAVEPGGICPPVARLSARGLARRAERGHEGAQPRHPLALAGHGTPGLRVVRFTPRGCGPRQRNDDGAREKRAHPHLPLVGGRAARRGRLSGSGAPHVGLGARGARGAGSQADVRRHPLTKNSLALLFKRLSRRAGFTRTPICPSMLRDTYAIRFLQSGGELTALREQLGVACLSSVKRYQHFCEQRKEERQAQASPEESMSTQQSQKGKRRHCQERRPGRGHRLSQR